MRAVIVTMFMLVYTTLFGQQTNLLETYRQTFEKQHQEFLNQYGFALNTVMETLKNKGDLDGVLLVKQEMERFTQQKTVPVPKNDKDLLYPVSKAYYDALVKLLERYINTLDAFTKQEVAADHIEEAIKGREKKEKALALLSEVKSKLPASNTLEEPKEKTSTNPITALLNLQNVSPVDKAALGSPMTGEDQTLFNGQLTIRAFTRGFLVVKSIQQHDALSVERVILQRKSPKKEPWGFIGRMYTAQGGKKKFGQPLEGELFLFQNTYCVHVFRRSLIICRNKDGNVQSVLFTKDFDTN